MQAINPRASHPQVMLTEIYIEALLVDEELADMVWEAPDDIITIAWNRFKLLDDRPFGGETTVFIIRD